MVLLTTDTKDTTGGIANPASLSKIDKLFACGVGDYIALPQLVVVGDQSSGKSSVLEGLTGLPFPRDSGLCTRFATHIIFRRAKQSSFSISIIPGKNASDEHAAKMRKWNMTLEDVSSSGFVHVMQEVHLAMGISGSAEGSKSTFSEDVLKLEISDPNQGHFSVVDVPGIFRNTAEGVTTKADQEMVKSMVLGYMENPRSVMLTVIPANVDVATQEILDMAQKVDPNGLRTLGVLTKPDLVDRGAEAPIIDLVDGRRYKLKLGWCIVRNSGQQDLKDSKYDRNGTEKMFFNSKAPWNSLDKERVGIEALKNRLQEILGNHTRQEFSKVRNEIHKKLEKAIKERDALGVKRDTTEEQRTYLIDLSVKFQKLTEQALGANYVASDQFDKDMSLRFATLVVARNTVYSYHVQKHGHLHRFDGDLNKPGSTDATDDVSRSLELLISLEPDSAFGDEDLASIPKDGFTNRVFGLVPDELQSLLAEEAWIDDEVDDNILEWLSDVYRSSRGFELGTFDSSILATTMKTQSEKWEALSLGYISDVVVMAHAFINKLLERICPDDTVRSALMSLLMDELLTKYKRAFQQVNFLLETERKGTPITMNHYFNDNLEKCRQKRIKSTMLTKAEDHSHYHGPGAKAVVSVDNIVQHHPMSNTAHTVQSIHDILKSYYKVARKRFVDNVCMQAADYYLINGPDTPLKLFSPLYVSNLSAEKVEEVAAEDVVLRRKRNALNQEIEKLEAGKKILR